MSKIDIVKNEEALSNEFADVQDALEQIKLRREKNNNYYKNVTRPRRIAQGKHSDKPYIHRDNPFDHITEHKQYHQWYYKYVCGETQKIKNQLARDIKKKERLQDEANKI